MAILVEDRDRHRRCIEDTGETNFRCAQVFGRFLARGTIEHEGARGAGRSVLSEGHAVEETDWKTLAVAAFEIDIELLGPHLAGSTRDAGEQSRAVSGNEIAEHKAAGSDLSEIVIEPGCKRRIHIRDFARLVAGEESGRRVIEKVDRMLQFLEDILVSIAFPRHVGDGPERCTLASGIAERLDPNSVPSRLGLAGERRR